METPSLAPPSLAPVLASANSFTRTVPPSSDATPRRKASCPPIPSLAPVESISIDDADVELVESTSMPPSITKMLEELRAMSEGFASQSSAPVITALPMDEEDEADVLELDDTEEVETAELPSLRPPKVPSFSDHDLEQPLYHAFIATASVPPPPEEPIVVEPKPPRAAVPPPPRPSRHRSRMASAGLLFAVVGILAAATHREDVPAPAASALAAQQDDPQADLAPAPVTTLATVTIYGEPPAPAGPTLPTRTEPKRSAAPAPAPAPAAAPAASPIVEAEAAMRAGELDRAERLYQGVLARGGSDFEALAGLGRIAQARHSAFDAMSFYERCLKLQPGYLPARLGLADTLWDAGRTDAAAAQYREIRARYANDVYPTRVIERSR